MRPSAASTVTAAPPATAETPRKLWEFKAGSPMVGLCIKAGNCSISRAGDDLLVVTSAKKHELLRLTTGELIALAKKGMFGAPVSVSPSGRYIASALSEKMRILDGGSGELVHEIAYPKGGEGMKSLRYMSWPSDDLVMTVFPDKKGKYVIGADPSQGMEHGDYASAHVINARNHEVVAHCHLHVAVVKL